MNDLNDILNHESNIALVHTTNADGSRQVQVLASSPLAPGDIIGPSHGLPAEAVVDPVEVLRCHDVGRAVLGIDSSSSSGKMAFWMSLAVMGRDAEERRQRREDEVAAGGGASPRKKRKFDACNTRDKGSNGENDANSATFEFQQRQQQIFDAYLVSLPREGPDPCCWSDDERSQLLQGTPLAKQIDVTLKGVRDDYDRAVAGISKLTDPNARGMKLPPFCIRGRGIFPSVLWARSMHQSRSFPRSLVDEEGVWWMGRKKYVPPSSSSACNGGGSDFLAGKDTGKVRDDTNCNTANTRTILSVRLGGWRAPVITLQKEPPSQTDEPNLHAKRHGSTLGIMVPLYDMLDHKPGHAVQWEAATRDNNQHCIRFRSVHSIAEGEPIWNNYGPKGNGELLATYGFATGNNILDSVEGIVLGLRIRGQINDNDNTDTTAEADGRVQVYEAQMALIKEHSIPHRLENDGHVLLLGPFSLHRKLPTNSDEEGDTHDETCGDDPDNTPKCSGGVIPDDLYRALSFIGMENVEEGPVVSEDELEMLQDVLTRKLDWFGSRTQLSERADACENDGDSSPAGAATVKRTPEELLRAKSVEAYKDGQRELLQLALAELVALMPCDGGEEEVSS
eukprot:CAMPEP_0201600606 /NCGR_PEP_ID=MMETSP0492-20130828/1606_1 /ASSEMBLY_ACC=CAM_ASM_000837 /TAXON_ID=420259 /ORGANISM="Thalassiosira gravida, Strain GMp14c1" /LENGTH=620 /DNA_ID=CAMNT_0048063397 /DNA_START=83 /DNA_END=1948 /DNA_ORIENTATION=-